MPESDLIAHNCNSGTWEAEAGGSLKVSGQPGLQSKTLKEKKNHYHHHQNNNSTPKLRTGNLSKVNWSRAHVVRTNNLHPFQSFATDFGKKGNKLCFIYLNCLIELMDGRCLKVYGSLSCREGNWKIE